MNQHWEDKESNKILCGGMIKNALDLKTELIIFPELTLTGFSMDTKNISEYFDNAPTIGYFKKQAFENEMGIVFGMCLNETIGYTNCAMYVSKSGEIETIYRKIHPFSFADEDKYFTPGTDISIFKLKDLSIGLSICYDLRFPELYRLYANDCQLQINIANWPAKRIDHWSTLLKARAIENQYVVIGVNRTGRDGNSVDYIESSKAFLPDGSLVLPEYYSNDLAVVEIDNRIVSEYRSTFPVLRDRRIEIDNKGKKHD